MGILDIFGKSKERQPFEIPAGTFTVDRNSRILSSTLPQSFPEECIHELAKPFIEAFCGAQGANVALTELVVHYSALKITAKELRGGAMVFLAPHGVQRQTN